MLWPGRPMAHVSPRARGTPQYRSGTLLMAATSTPTAVISISCMAWPGRLMARASLRRMLIARCRCGTPLMAAMSSPTVVIPVSWRPWPGRAIARTSPRQVLIRRCRCGSQGKDQAGEGRGYWSRVRTLEQGDRKGRPYISNHQIKILPFYFIQRTCSQPRSRATARVAPTFLFHPTRLFPAKMTMTVQQAHHRHGLPPIYDAYGGGIEEDTKSGRDRSAESCT